MKLLAAIIAAMMLIPVSAYAQQPGPSRFDIIQANYSGPVFLDAFWTDRTTPPAAGTSLQKVEVAPGDGASVLAVTLANRGFSEITAVRGTLSLPTGFSSSGGNEAEASNSGIVSAGGVFTLFFQVSVSERTRVGDYSTSLHVEYSRTLETGTPRTADLNIPFKVTGKVIIDASAQGGVASGGSSRVPIEITNTGSAPATGVVVTVPGSSGVNTTTQQAAIVALGQKTFELGVIPPGESKTIEPTLYVAETSGEALQAVALNVTYGNAYGERKTSNVPVGLVVLPETASSPVSVSPVGESSIITAGKITDLSVSLINNRDQELSDVVVSVSSQSDSIKILGFTSWSIGDLQAGSSQEISTRVFASEDMIGRATTFVFTVQHVSAGQPQVETVSLGTYVDGEISIKAYEVGVTYIGGRPNLTGNLLNEGNVLALFTTVQVVSAGDLVESLPPQQYLGDLTENSPLPFSIPIDVPEGTGAGTYPVELKIQYRDTLRQLHTLDVSANVDFVPEVVTENGSQQAGSQAMASTVAGGVAAAAVIAFVIFRMRKKAKLKRTLQFSKQNGGQDIESVLDTHLGKPEEKK